mmetsp:Transcript_28781/g.77964  ORF Transcript_28781/g.77964 Transcript_28781/m.77964 type:complete len:257 (-) Transcript_28781:294-1064(-)
MSELWASEGFASVPSLLSMGNLAPAVLVCMGRPIDDRPRFLPFALVVVVLPLVSKAVVEFVALLFLPVERGFVLSIVVRPVVVSPCFAMALSMSALGFTAVPFCAPAVFVLVKTAVIFCFFFGGCSVSCPCLFGFCSCSCFCSCFCCCLDDFVAIFWFAPLDLEEFSTTEAPGAAAKAVSKDLRTDRRGGSFSLGARAYKSPLSFVTASLKALGNRSSASMTPSFRSRALRVRASSRSFIFSLCNLSLSDSSLLCP